MQWKAIDRNSQDYITLQTQDKVRFYKTPDSVLKRQLELYDEITKKYVGDQSAVQGDHPVAARSSPSGRRNGSRTTVTPRRMAFDHYFGPNAKIADLTAICNRQSTIPAETEWCFVLANRQSHE